MNTRRLIKAIPIVGKFATFLNTKLRNQSFKGSEAYWEDRYSKGGDSGSGSYNRLAEFKARVLNDFVLSTGATSVIEFGCGDGNQLKYARYPKYVGLDVSPSAIKRCHKLFEGDLSKSFFLYNTQAFVDSSRLFNADIAISLDVLYHIVEDDIYSLYLKHLFSAATTYVAIYSSNFRSAQERHCRHRVFLDDITRDFPEWRLFKKVENEFPRTKDNCGESSVADFYFFRRAD